MEKSRKEKEVMKIERQIDECLCSNACNVCANNLNREESETEWKSKTRKWKSESRKEWNNLVVENFAHGAELDHMKRHGRKVRKRHYSNQWTRYGWGNKCWNWIEIEEFDTQIIDFLKLKPVHHARKLD